MTSQSHAITDPKGGRELGPDNQRAESPAGSGPATEPVAEVKARSVARFDDPAGTATAPKARNVARSGSDGPDRAETTIFEEVLERMASGHLLVYPIDLASATGRSAGSLYRTCKQMCESGWLQPSGTPGDIAYRAGPKLWKLLNSYIAGSLYEAEQASQTIAAARDSINGVASRLERAIESARASAPSLPAQGDARDSDR